jgi:hypothetical protein
MNKKMMREDDDVENMGIMQGFMDSMAEDDDENEGDDEGDPEMMMERRPDSPEILMNNLRGDMRSVSARRDELADLVGYQAATETPDSVLAMLQPVLAQQGGGGIGALPQSQPMAQGPQPPMMGGAPGMPPPGMPPMPPDAGMPPPPEQGGIAELMASMGGGAPGGGMPPPPQQGGMPPSDQPPIAMARGGLVQNFQAGSDENGVTPAGSAAVPDDLMMFPPDVVAAARRSSMDLFNQRPAATPTLSEATASRLPEYTRLLGADRGAAEAQLLFDLGQRAFGFAGNVDDAGRPLRGSFMSRLAGATRTLPAAMGKRIDEISKIDRQLKVLALQQGEKDIDQVVTQNNELLKRKTDIFKDVLRADAKLQAQKLKMGDSIWGKGDWQWNVVNMPGLTDRYAQGLTKPEEDKLMASAIMQFKLGRQELRIHPVTRIPDIVQVPGVLPDFVAQAEAARKRLGLPTVPQPVMNPTAGARPAAPDAGAAAPGAVAAGGAPAAGMPPAGAPAGAPAAGAAAQGPRPMTLWATRFDVAGPGAAAVAGVSAIPGLGDPASSVTLARKNAELMAERLKEAMLKSVAGSVWEQKNIDKVMAIQPSAWTDPDVYGTRLIALGQVLREGIASYRKMGADDSGLSPEDKGKAREKAMEYQKFLGQLGLPPAVYSEADIRKYPAGTEVLVNGVTLKRIRAPQ